MPNRAGHLPLAPSWWAQIPTRTTALSRTMALFWHRTHLGLCLQMATTRRHCAAWHLRTLSCVRLPTVPCLQHLTKKKAATMPHLSCAGYPATAVAAMNKGIHHQLQRMTMEEHLQLAARRHQVLAADGQKNTPGVPVTPSSSNCDPRSGHGRAKDVGRSRRHRQQLHLKWPVARKHVAPWSESTRSSSPIVLTAIQQQWPSGS